MATQTICGFCKSSKFEISEQPVGGPTSYKLVFIRCSACGSAVATMDVITTNELFAEIQKVKKAIGIDDEYTRR